MPLSFNIFKMASTGLVSPENIMTREHPPEQGIEYLRAKQALFKEKLTQWNMLVIDANRDKDVIFQEILKRC